MTATARLEEAQGHHKVGNTKNASKLYMEIIENYPDTPESEIAKVALESPELQKVIMKSSTNITQENISRPLNDYATSIAVAKFVSGCGWALCIVAILLTIIALSSAGRMGVLAILPNISIFVGGLLLVVAGQTSRAVFDNTNIAKEMLAQMKNSSHL